MKPPSPHGSAKETVRLCNRRTPRSLAVGLVSDVDGKTPCGGCVVCFFASRLPEKSQVQEDKNCSLQLGEGEHPRTCHQELEQEARGLGPSSRQRLSNGLCRTRNVYSSRRVHVYDCFRLLSGVVATTCYHAQRQPRRQHQRRRGCRPPPPPSQTPLQRRPRPVPSTRTTTTKHRRTPPHTAAVTTAAAAATATATPTATATTTKHEYKQEQQEQPHCNNVTLQVKVLVHAWMVQRKLSVHTLRQICTVVQALAAISFMHGVGFCARRIVWTAQLVHVVIAIRRLPTHVVAVIQIGAIEYS